MYRLLQVQAYTHFRVPTLILINPINQEVLYWLQRNCNDASFVLIKSSIRINYFLRPEVDGCRKLGVLMVGTRQWCLQLKASWTKSTCSVRWGHEPVKPGQTLLSIAGLAMPTSHELSCTPPACLSPLRTPLRPCCFWKTGLYPGQ